MVPSFKYWNACVDPPDMEALWMDPKVRTEWINAGETKGQNIHLSRGHDGQPYLTQTEMKAVAEIIVRRHFVSQIDPDMICAIAELESDRQPTATRYNKKTKEISVGIMQILPEKADWLVRDLGYRAYDVQGNSELLYRPFVNVYLGAAYLKWLSNYDQKERSEEFIVRAYKGGPKKATHKSTLQFWNQYLSVKGRLLSSEVSEVGPIVNGPSASATSVQHTTGNRRNTAQARDMGAKPTATVELPASVSRNVDLVHNAYILSETGHGNIDSSSNLAATMVDPVVHLLAVEDAASTEVLVPSPKTTLVPEETMVSSPAGQEFTPASIQIAPYIRVGTTSEGGSDIPKKGIFAAPIAPIFPKSVRRRLVHVQEERDEGESDARELSLKDDVTFAKGSPNLETHSADSPDKTLGDISLQKGLENEVVILSDSPFGTAATPVLPVLTVQEIPSSSTLATTTPTSDAFAVGASILLSSKISFKSSAPTDPSAGLPSKDVLFTGIAQDFLPFLHNLYDCRGQMFIGIISKPDFVRAMNLQILGVIMQSLDNKPLKDLSLEEIEQICKSLDAIRFSHLDIRWLEVGLQKARNFLKASNIREELARVQGDLKRAQDVVQKLKNDEAKLLEHAKALENHSDSSWSSDHSLCQNLLKSD